MAAPSPYSQLWRWELLQYLTTISGGGGGGGGTKLTASDTSPIGPAANDLWWETDTGALYIWYNDGDSSQWVMIAPGAYGTPTVVSDIDMQGFKVVNSVTMPPGNNTTTMATTGFVMANTAVFPKVTKFTAGSSWTPDPKLIHGFAMAKGGGGGGGGANVVVSNITGCCGGGEGMLAYKYFRKSDVTGSYTVTVGAGGAAGNGGTVGGTGGDSALGTLVVAKGGAGGQQFAPGYGVGGGTGDIIIFGACGEMGSSASSTSGTTATAGGGGGAGAGSGQMNGTGGTYNAGMSAIANSGAGGGGGASHSAGPGPIPGGGGGSGFVYVVEYCSL
jgi:hypothetical protein